MKKHLIFLFLGSFCASFSQAQITVSADIEAKKAEYIDMAQKIWNLAEPGYLENQTSDVLKQNLTKNGFTISAVPLNMPTAFIATYGSGSPVIAILAEMDALPGLSQEAVPYKKAKALNAYGHGCGHNLFGVGSTAAAVAIKNWLVSSKTQGTVRLIATPAEEGAGGGKTYLVKAGVFKDVDAVLHWHPGDNNNASPNASLAYRVANFTFEGQAAHASASPEKGRSALDAVEAMNYMVNMMREHITPETRIHYVIKNGGLTSNIVPDYAKVEYTIRNPTAQGLEDVWARLMKTAQAAALGTETKMQMEVMAGLYDLLPNVTLAKAMQKSLENVGGINYDVTENEFAEKLQKTVASAKLPAISDAKTVAGFKEGLFFWASTDVGDVSYVVPTAGLSTATWVPGTPAHSWQAVACNGMSIGHKGMLTAAKTIANTAVDLFTNPSTITAAKKELDSRRGPNFTYKSLAGEREAPLDYRK
jgi:aminobenzoyl-glutamate utilization protein B